MSKQNYTGKYCERCDKLGFDKCYCTAAPTQKLSDIKTGDKITVKGWWGIQEMTAIGEGAYPYECIAKDEHPNSMIFTNVTGGWLAGYELANEANKYGQFETTY